MICPVERDHYRHCSQDDVLYQEQVEAKAADIADTLLDNGWLCELRADHFSYNDHLQDDKLQLAMLAARDNDSRLAALTAWRDWLAQHPATVLTARGMAEKALTSDDTPAAKYELLRASK